MDSTANVVPQFLAYQLIGDSLLLRFAEQLLSFNAKQDPSTGTRYLGLCVSGQTVGDLRFRLRNKLYPISEKLVLLIGTNDMLKNTHKSILQKHYKYVVKKLKQHAKEIIVVTLPPIPRLAKWSCYWNNMYNYNELIKRTAQKNNFKVADITSLFLSGHSNCRMELYERQVSSSKFYGSSTRKDYVHLNLSGLRLLHNFLINEKFIEY